MDRRHFFQNSALLTSGVLAASASPSVAAALRGRGRVSESESPPFNNFYDREVAPQ